MPLRVFDENGQGYEWDVIQALYWAIDHGADIVNMSFSTYYPGRTLETAINAALDAGVILMASVSNDSTSVAAYPAAYDGVIAVSAIDTLEYRATFSSFGPHVDLCAPGVTIYSSFAGEHPWGTWSGTSFAVALVSGSTALALQAHPEYAGSAMQSHLQSTARTALAWGSFNPPSSFYGYGCLDALAAVLPSSVAGDLNGSGLRDMADLTLLLHMVNDRAAGTRKATGNVIADVKVDAIAADVNRDGAVDSADIDAMVALMFQQSQRGYRLASQ
jgi:subtilisin family serine protease